MRDASKRRNSGLLAEQGSHSQTLSSQMQRGARLPLLREAPAVSCMYCTSSANRISHTFNTHYPLQPSPSHAAMAPPRIISFPRHPIEGLPLQKARPFNAPPGKTPQDLFTHDISEDTAFRCIGQPDRFVRRNADCEMLIYVDGSCLDQNTKVDVGANRWSAPAESSVSSRLFAPINLQPIL